MKKKLITTEAIPSSAISKKSSDVQIGFEFEICIPKKSVDQSQKQLYSTTDLSWLSGKTIRTIYDKAANWGRYGPFVGKSFNECIADIFRVKRSAKRRLNLPSVDLDKLWGAHQKLKRKNYEAKSQEERAQMIWYLTLETLQKVHELKRLPGVRNQTVREVDSSIRYFLNNCKNIGLDIIKLRRSRQIPNLNVDTINAIIDIARRLYLDTDKPVDVLWYYLRNATDINVLYPISVGFYDLSGNGISDYEKWLTELFGSSDIKTLLDNSLEIRARPSLNRNSILTVLWAYTSPEASPLAVLDPNAGGHQVYSSNMRSWLKNNLESLFGKVEVFSRYHQESKLLDRWYIEPDGSLRPDTGDYAAEVVGPPMPVKQSIEALNKFITFCKQNGIYTNTSTGLHINVSIPGYIDPLKLVVFSGDDYALKKFGRENSTYATSIMSALRNNKNLLDSIISFSKNDAQKTIPSTILDIANTIAENHFSSVNITRKGYVSFRHAGGNYLDDLDGILIVMRNFVRAMVLATNPELGKQEYLAKLTRFIPPTQTIDFNISEIKESLIKNGIMMTALQVIIFNTADNTKANIMQAARGDIMSDNQYTLFKTETGDEWESDFISGGGLMLNTIEIIRMVPSNSFHTLYYLPINPQTMRLDTIKNEMVGSPYGVYSSGFERLGVARKIKKRLLPGSPEWREAFTFIMKTLIRQSGGQPNLPE